MSRGVFKILMVLAFLSLLVALTVLIVWNVLASGPFWILFLFLLGAGFRGSRPLKGFTYTIMIFAAVTAAMFYPSYFISIGDFTLSRLIVPLLQLIMFGMGTSMSLADFKGVVKMPKGVLAGVLCQFTIMPFVGYTLATISSLPVEVAAGIILVGCSPSGMASNVMSFLAKANLALSITITAITTMIAPFITPLLMGWLAGEMVEVDVWKMMLDIVKIVIIPIGLGLLFNKLLKGKAIWLDKAMPLVSMIGIGVIIVIITAAGRESLLTIGPLLVFLVVIHNLTGYTLGFWAGKLFGMDERDCRTIALEVGMQNGGLASGLAKEMGKLATVGLAPAVFGPLMNVTGSILASYWHRREPKE